MKTTFLCFIGCVMFCVVQAQSEHKLLAGDGAASDVFGSAVDISGSFAIVGSPNDDDNGLESGAAYIYEYSGGAWTEVQKLVPATIFPDDLFGTSVAISGNLAIVGCPFDDDSGTNSGSAYVYRYNGSTWVEETKLLASDGANDDEFGFAVDIEGTTAVVGAYRNDAAASNSGAAYVFEYNGSTWPEVDKLSALDGTVDDFFGYSVALSGDVIVVGAYLDDDLGVNSGGVYVFRESTPTWPQEQKLIPGNGSAGDAFGFDVAIDNDLIAIAAYAKDNSATDDGLVYLYRYSGTWMPEDELTASDGAMDDWLGYSIGVSGNLVIAGAFHQDDLGAESGAFYLYGYDGSVWHEELKIEASDGEFGDFYGQAVGMEGYLTICGAINDDDNGIDAGAAYIYDICTYTPVQEICLVTVDSTTPQNLVVWQEPVTSLIDSFSVYRTTSGSNLLATYEYGLVEEHADVMSSPWIAPEDYVITTTNQCDVESDSGTVHTTIYLEATPNGGDIDLSWTPAAGFSFPYYNIWRDSTGTGDYQLLWATLSSQFSWTDSNPPGTGTLHYLIEAERGMSCNPQWASSISNISNPFLIGVDETERETYLTVFPNPTNDNLSIVLSELGHEVVTVELYDLRGKLAFSYVILSPSETNILELSDLDRGMYFLQVLSSQNEVIGTAKVVLN